VVENRALGVKVGVTTAAASFVLLIVIAGGVVKRTCRRGEDDRAAIGDNNVLELVLRVLALRRVEAPRLSIMVGSFGILYPQEAPVAVK
jgi:hypothetical protein